jgi:response regulator RpfG family c-di-GMP phosphodiesterase
MGYYILFLSSLFVLILLSLIFVLLFRNINKKGKETDKHFKEIAIRYEEILLHIVNTLEEASTMNDVETGTHIKRVSSYCEYLSQALGKEESFIKEIKQYASLHDLGKIAIPSQILKKPDKLSKEEFEIIKGHVKIGSQLIGKLHLSQMAKNIIEFHHENWDGSGYLHGLKGKEIPIEARIMSLVDVYDALRMKRVYKEALTHEEAVDAILIESGKKFDPELVELFRLNHKGFQRIYDHNIPDLSN